MIRRLAIAAALAFAAVARAQDAPVGEPPPAEPPLGEETPAEAGPGEVQVEDDVLSPYRARFDVLAERTIGTTSRPVEFDWRRAKVQVGLAGSYLAELNNFNSMRGGALVRLPSGGVLIEIGVSGVAVWDSPASRALALTPYRQPGRPDRLELDLAVGLPLAEGVVTVAPRYFPAVQMVFLAYGGFRYVVYPTSFGGMRPGQVAGAIFAPALGETEIANLEGARLDAMQLDPGRYGLMMGLGNDLYFKSGFFLSPRTTIAVPLLAVATQTELLVWADFSIAVGVAF